MFSCEHLRTAASESCGGSHPPAFSSAHLNDFTNYTREHCFYCFLSTELHHKRHSDMKVFRTVIFRNTAQLLLDTLSLKRSTYCHTGAVFQKGKLVRNHSKSNNWFGQIYLKTLYELFL